MRKQCDHLILQNLIALQMAPASLFTTSKSAVVRQVSSKSLNGNSLAQIFKQLPRKALKAAEIELDTALENGLNYLTIFDADYPDSLLNIADPPLILTYRGEITPLKTDSITQQHPDPPFMQPPRVAVVGTRECSAAARKIAYDWSEILTRLGVEIVSGLARGVDSCAHRGAINGAHLAQGAASGGIAVLGSGLLQIYPDEHRELVSQIVNAGGVVMSEAPVNKKPEPYLFPRRNRIVSGLSQIVLVIEAPKRSGALITARTALEQGREVLVVPGTPDDPRCEGSNQMLRDGARAAITVEDVVDALPHWERAKLKSSFNTEPRPHHQTTKIPNPEPLTPNCAQILTHLETRGESTIDELCERTTLTPAEVLTALTELELAGHITPIPGSIYRLSR